ncbi:hypothetical protein RHGRI_008476 [Rhododendron griersonianum]|uniref:MBD domain-containing protein n=1 Tax=Rhododendron griersonianum TaxID=479676 RepID=A0AAV6L1N0_9ERIC|nr:hypothetical protein RHGRI_008476 [Rhododendron griersonianum]
MAEQSSSPEWLPTGWTVEVRIRKNGKRDTCYSDPSNKLKFFSKPEVLRYLNNAESNRHKSNGKRKAGRSRKLSAIKSPAVAEQLNLADSRANEPMTRNRSSKVVGVLKEDQTFEICTGEQGTTMICFDLSKASDSKRRERSDPKAVVGVVSENLAENGVENPGNKRLQLRASEKNNREKPDLPREKSDPKAVVGAVSENLAENGVENPGNKRLQLQASEKNNREKPDLPREKSDPKAVVGEVSENLAENGVENPENKRLPLRASEKNNREKPDLPRRASKRLAGIEVGPIAELKTNNRTHRVSVRPVDEAETDKAENLLDSAPPEKCVEKRATEEKGDDIKADEERGGSPRSFSLKDLWTDPCIEFAIKTLTDAIPIEDEYLAEENPGSSVEWPFGDSWGDPCIDFAVKTLTGAIPVVDDFGISECPLTSSSETMQDKGSEISNAGLHNSGDAGIHPHCEERSGELQRKTIRG